MFCERFLTQEMHAFLAQEYQFFTNYLSRIKEYNTIIEVGSGYGRHLNVCKMLNKNYIGIDLIEWLTDIGKWRNSFSDKQNDTSFHSQSILQLETIFDQYGGINSEEVLVYFPFNCLGNIPYIEDIFNVMANNNISFACSVFNNNTATAEIRSQYYQHCGLHISAIDHNLDHTIIRSKEGLESIGYDIKALKKYIIAHQFNCVTDDNITDIASFLVFKPVSKKANAEYVRIPTPYQGHQAILFHTINVQLLPKNSICYYLVNNSEPTTTGLFDFSTASIEEMSQNLPELKQTICPVGVIEYYQDNNFSVIPVQW
jgi:hypothetical protein